MYYKYTVLERRYQEFETIIVKKLAKGLHIEERLLTLLLDLEFF